MIRIDAPEPVPIPDFSFLYADEGPDRLIAVLGVAAAVCLALAVIATVWTVFGEPPLSVQLSAVTLMIAAVALATFAFRRDIAHEEKLEEAGPVTLGTYLGLEDRIGEMLEEYYGIDFYWMPRIPESGVEPQFGLISTPEGVKLCWVHTVEAEDRLAVSCGTHDATTSTELPVAAP